MGLIQNLSISRKIFLAIFFFNLLGMLVTILYTTSHFRNTSEKYHEDRLIRKEERVLETFDYLVNKENITEDDLAKSMINNVNEIADINNMDINIYDIRGNLLTSNLGVNNPYVAKRINSDIVAKVVLRDERVEVDSLIKGEKNIGSFYRINSYNAFKNNNQDIIAIVNIPYVDSNDFLEEEYNNLLATLLGINTILIIGSSILGWLIAQSITRKMKNLAKTVSEKDAVFENKPIEYSQNDEIKPLVDSYNSVLEKFKKQSQDLAQIEREDAWKEMAKQVAHEIKNPLTPMRLLIQKYQLQFDKDDPEIETKTQEISKTLIQQIDMLNSITDAFSDFAKMPNRLQEEINVSEVVEDALELFNKDWIDYSSDNTELIAEMDRIYLTRVITNLVKNAIQSIPNSEKKVSVHIYDKEDNYQISISDNGKGIPPEVQDKIFEPKFTTKNSGMGLGLAMVKRIIEEYHGKIWFTSSKEGTSFFIDLPKFESA